MKAERGPVVRKHHDSRLLIAVNADHSLAWRRDMCVRGITLWCHRTLNDTGNKID